MIFIEGGDGGYRCGNISLLGFLVLVVINLGVGIRVFDCFLLKRGESGYFF